MSELRLAGNYINQPWNSVLPVKGGHFQVVLTRDNGEQLEIEVLPSGAGSGNWTYPNGPNGGVPQDHLANTPEHVMAPLWYRYATIDLGDRSAENVWAILEQVHDQFNKLGRNIPYDPLEINSNSYATTVLSIAGIDINKYASAAMPLTVLNPLSPSVTTFPGQGKNVLEDEKYAISLDLEGGTESDVIRTGLRDDTLAGRAGNDELGGGGGNDTLIGGPGNDRLDGGDGIDTASYSTSSAGVTINFDTSSATGGDAEGDTLVSIENLIGSQYDDKLTGNSGDNVMTGALGNDQFEVFAGNDKITDFKSSEDSLWLPTNGTTISGSYLNNRDTVLTYPGGTVTLADVNLGPEASKYPWLTWSDIPWGTITGPQSPNTTPASLADKPPILSQPSPTSDIPFFTLGGQPPEMSASVASDDFLLS